MKRLIQTLVAFVAMATVANAATIHVYTALAPNGFGSPSYATWQANAVSAMQNNGATTGTVGSPTLFQQQANVTSAEAIVTGFPSWMGVTDPGTNVGLAYANELGNRMHFPLWIDGGGSTFSISQLGMTMDSNDPGNSLDYNWAVGGYNYGAGYVGLQWGANNARGGGDDVWITGGANTQMVNELFGRGSGNSFAAYCAGCTVAQQQAALDAVAAYPGTPFQFIGTYYLMGNGQELARGSATFNVTPVPEPASLGLLGFGLVGLASRLRRRP